MSTQPRPDGRSDIVLFGTGSFAARILFDLAAFAPSKLAITVVGRDPMRAGWLRTAALARASIFGSRVHVTEEVLPVFSTEAAAELLARRRPSVVANTASVQGGRPAVPRADAWSRVVAAGGLGVTALLQARISLDLARAVATTTPQAFFVNCCYPDVVNGLIAAAGLPIACGIGNVAILAHAFAGMLGPDHGRLQLLAQHAALAAFRRRAAERIGHRPPRVWLDGAEIPDVFRYFEAVQLAPEPVIDVSGASGIPVLLAMANRTPWRGHLPGPNGLPGGYPVQLHDGALALDLPPGLAPEAAIGWNAAFEQADGVVVGRDGRVRYTGRVHAALHQVSADLAEGFSIEDVDAAGHALAAARAGLQAKA